MQQLYRTMCLIIIVVVAAAAPKIASCWTKILKLHRRCLQADNRKVNITSCTRRITWKTHLNQISARTSWENQSIKFSMKIFCLHIQATQRLFLSDSFGSFPEPHIISPPYDIWNITGQDVIFGCEVFAYPMASIEWRKEGSDMLLPGDDPHISVQVSYKFQQELRGRMICVYGASLKKDFAAEDTQITHLFGRPNLPSFSNCISCLASFIT